MLELSKAGATLLACALLSCGEPEPLTATAPRAPTADTPGWHEEPGTRGVPTKPSAAIQLDPDSGVPYPLQPLVGCKHIKHRTLPIATVYTHGAIGSLGDNEVYGGPCPDGSWHAEPPRVEHTGSGHCEARWLTDNPFDCRILTHRGKPFFSSSRFRCEVTAVSHSKECLHCGYEPEACDASNPCCPGYTCADGRCNTNSLPSWPVSSPPIGASCSGDACNRPVDHGPPTSGDGNVQMGEFSCTGTIITNGQDCSEQLGTDRVCIRRGGAIWCPAVYDGCTCSCSLGACPNSR